MLRRLFLTLGAQALVSSAFAQNTLDRSKRVWMVVPWPAGGMVDVSSRAVVDRLSKETGLAILSDNRPGATGNLGALQVSKAAPDGSTLLYTTSAMVMSAALKGSATSRIIDSFTPVARIGTTPLVLVASLASGITSLAGLQDAAREKPGAIAYASAGNGSPGHFSAEMMARHAKLSFLHVPYRGAPPALNDLLGGQVAFMFAPASVVMPHARTGKLRVLAVCNDKRMADFPGVTTMVEAGFSEFKVNQWIAVFAPKATPVATVNQLNAAIVTVLRQPDTREALERLGIDVDGSTSRDKFAEEIARDLQFWVDVANAADIRAD